MRCRCLTLVMIFACGASTPAAAQSASDRHRHRFDVSLGGAGVSGGRLGADTADLRRNSTTAADFPLFRADTRVESSPGFDGRVAYWLTRSLALEGGMVFMRPVVRTRVSGDAEGAAALTLEEDLDQYFFDIGGVLLLDRIRLGERTIPFVSGGAGYLRQLHEGRTLIESGQVYHLGGGLRHWLWGRDRRFLRAAGLRADVRAYVLVNGFALDDGPRSHAAVSGAFFVTF